MAHSINKPFPLYVLLVGARQWGLALWWALATLPQRAFQRLRGSLRMKFIVVIVALRLAMMGVITVVMEHHQRTGILEQARLRALSSALNRAALSEEYLLSYNFIKLEQTAEKMASSRTNPPIASSSWLGASVVSAIWHRTDETDI